MLFTANCEVEKIVKVVTKFFIKKPATNHSAGFLVIFLLNLFSKHSS